MATGMRIRGIRARIYRNTRRSLSYERRATKNKHPSNSSEYSDSGEEDLDEPDRCLTDHFRHKDDDPLCGEDRSSNSIDTSKTKCHLPSPSKIRKRGKLYPDLSELEDETSKSRREGWPPFILIGFVFFLIVFLFTVGHGYKTYQMSHNFMKTKTLDEVSKEIERDVIQLSKVTNQNKKFWIQFLSQTKILTSEVLPIQPAIILAVVPIDSAKTAACLSQKMLEIVSNAFQDSKYISFDVRSHLGRNSTVLKHNLEDFFQDLNKFHAAAVYNLEKLQPEAAMILHGYCDNENAPYKRALFYFTLEIDINYLLAEERRLDSTVSDYLAELWSSAGLRPDDVGAIVSRIANSPVLFKPEDKHNILRHCPY